MRKTLLGAVSATAVFVSMPAVAQDTEAPAAQNPSQQAVSTDGDIVVTGVRQSLERAAEIKRNATQVVDSTVATDIGKLPDPTVAAPLQPVPGTQVQNDRNTEPRSAQRRVGTECVSTSRSRWSP